MGLSESIDRAVERILTVLKQEPTRSLPKSVAESELEKGFSKELAKAAIRNAVDRCLVNLVVDYPDEKWGINRGVPAWHLKLMNPEDVREIQGLKPAELALIRLLQQQDDPEHVGEMKEKDARATLVDEGFSEQDLRSLWIDDMVDSLFMYEGDKSIEWVRLIPEEEKTEEYKRHEEEMLLRAVDRESMEIRGHEECEKEQARQQKRKSRTTKKASRTRSV